MHNRNFLDLDKELLYDLYVNKGYTLKELADEIFFCSHPTILNRMKEYGIERRHTGRRFGSKNKIKKVKQDG